MRTFATHLGNGPVAQLNRASDYGSEGYRFESCRDHLRNHVYDSFFCYKLILISLNRGSVEIEGSPDKHGGVNFYVLHKSYTFAA